MVYEMKAKQMQLIGWIQDTNTFHMKEERYNTSKHILHKRSILWLWTLRPTTTVPLPVPLSMNIETDLFSTPRSHRTRDGNPRRRTASKK